MKLHMTLGLINLNTFLMMYAQLGHIFNETYSHHTASIIGLNIHYVIGGVGEPLVLLHGYPQTWYAFRHVMPLLAKYFTVIVPDLRGFGDSGRNLMAYDTYSVADDIYQLVQSLGFEKIRLLGHDFGAQVAYAYAAMHREEVLKLAILDIGVFDSTISQYPIVPEKGRMLWWFPFHIVSELPEHLVEGKEEYYLRWFYANSTFNKAAFNDADIAEFVRCYSGPGGMKAGFEYYRALGEDIRQNTEQLKTSLRMPVLAVGGDHNFGMVVYESWKKAAENIQPAIIPQCGHYNAEEQPEALLNVLIPFFV